MKAKRIVVTTLALVMVSICVFAIFAANAIAQEEEGARTDDTPFFEWEVLARDIILMTVYSIIGLIILMIGYKIFDLATPYDLNRQIAEENNVAAGIAVAGVLVSLGIIVAAAM